MTLDAMKAQLGNGFENFNKDHRPYYGHMQTFVKKSLYRESFN